MSTVTPEKRIFMTGASGYIGLVITELAIAAGYKVHGLSRTEANDQKLITLGATPVRGDLSTLDILSRESAPADVVFHMAFIHDFNMDYAEVLRIDTTAVDALAAPLAGTHKPLVISSGCAGAQANADGSETDEQTPQAPNPLVQRMRAEEHALSWKTKGVHVNSIRLSPYVYGRGGKGFLATLMQMAAKSGESIYVDEGANRTSCVYVDDAARLYLLVAEKADAGEVFNCTGDTTVTNRQMATAIGDALGVPVKSVPKAEVEQRWGKFVTTFVTNENRASSRKAREMLGWESNGIGLLKDVREGSYQEVAAALKLDRARDPLFKTS